MDVNSMTKRFVQFTQNLLQSAWERDFLSTASPFKLKRVNGSPFMVTQRIKMYSDWEKNGEELVEHYLWHCSANQIFPTNYTSHTHTQKRLRTRPRVVTFSQLSELIMLSTMCWQWLEGQREKYDFAFGLRAGTCLALFLSVHALYSVDSTLLYFWRLSSFPWRSRPQYSQSAVKGEWEAREGYPQSTLFLCAEVG